MNKTGYFFSPLSPCTQFHFSLARFAAGDNGCEIREPAPALRSGLVSSETAYQTVGFYFNVLPLLLLLCLFVCPSRPIASISLAVLQLDAHALQYADRPRALTPRAQVCVKAGELIEGTDRWTDNVICCPLRRKYNRRCRVDDFHGTKSITFQREGTSGSNLIAGHLPKASFSPLAPCYSRIRLNGQTS